MKKVLDDIQVFCAVVENQSLKKTAEKLNLPHSTVSRRIDALEKSLKLNLLHRTTREITITQRGQQLYQQCAPLIQSLAYSIESTINDEIAFKGHLKISMPTRAGIDFLGEWLIDFSHQYTELQLQLELTNINQNLVRNNIDLAFRVGPLVDSSAIALRLWDIPYSLCASKRFIAQHQIDINNIEQQQLSQLPAVVALPSKNWAFVDDHQQEILIEPNQQLTVDDLGLACHAIASDRYIGLIPSVMNKNPDLVSLNIKHLSPRTRVMYAYYFGKRHTISQIKHLVDYIKTRYQQQLA